MSEKAKEIKSQNCILSKPLQVQLNHLLHEWQAQNKLQRLWQRDTGLWTAKDEGQWLGWLWNISAWQERSAYLKQLAANIETDLLNSGIHQVVLLGMGGSSLVSEVLEKTFGQKKDSPVFMF